jgi:orotidine-5'-phosphate decarboxylase
VLAQNAIIWSADGISRKQVCAAAVGSETRAGLPPEIAIKLDRLFIQRHGCKAIDRVQDLGRPVFADAKIMEITSKCLELAKDHLRYRPWMLNIMAGAGSTGLETSEHPDKVDCLKQFADLCHQSGTRPCAVTVLTNKTDQQCRREFGRTAEEQVLIYVEDLIRFGFTDIVCSAQEAEAIHREFGEKIAFANDDDRWKIRLNTPGIRLPSSDSDDQARITTPREAFELGAARLVIGRPLSQGGTFAENYANIMTNIEGGD